MKPPVKPKPKALANVKPKAPPKPRGYRGKYPGKWQLVEDGRVEREFRVASESGRFQLEAGTAAEALSHLKTLADMERRERLNFVVQEIETTTMRRVRVLAVRAGKVRPATAEEY